MERLGSIEFLCCACLWEPDDLAEVNQLIFLTSTQIGKLNYIGGSYEAESKLDCVYDFVKKLNFSKLKIAEYARQSIDTGDIFPRRSYLENLSQDLNSKAVCKIENFGDGGHDKVDLIKTIKIESSPPPHECNSISNLLFIQILKSEDICQLTSEAKSKLKFKKKSESRSTKGYPSPNADNACHICEKRFSSRSNMLRHAREHLSVSFLCEYENCDASFTQRSSLKCHYLAHEGIKPYACVSCDKKFSRNSSLVLHTRVHTGESPYICDYCGKSFKQKSNLIRHFKTHRKPQRPRQHRFQCQKCSRYFSSKLSLTRHLARHDRIDLATKRIKIITS